MREQILMRKEKTQENENTESLKQWPPLLPAQHTPEKEAG